MSVIRFLSVVCQQMPSNPSARCSQSLTIRRDPPTFFLFPRFSGWLYSGGSGGLASATELAALYWSCKRGQSIKMEGSDFASDTQDGSRVAKRGHGFSTNFIMSIILLYFLLDNLAGTQGLIDETHTYIKFVIFGCHFWAIRVIRFCNSSS